jgi:hypothetical protein
LFGRATESQYPTPGSIDKQLADLPASQSKRLIERFNAMIEGVRLVGKAD